MKGAITMKYSTFLKEYLQLILTIRKLRTTLTTSKEQKRIKTGRDLRMLKMSKATSQSTIRFNKKGNKERIKRKRISKYVICIMKENRNLLSISCMH